MLVPSFKATSPSLDGGSEGEWREAAIELLMAVIIRCFESALSLVRATLPVSRPLAKLQSYVTKKKMKKSKKKRAKGPRREFYDECRRILARFDRNYLANYSLDTNVSQSLR